MTGQDADLEGGTFRWFWGERLGEIQGHVRYHYSRRIFLSKTDDKTALVGLSIPEDASDEHDGEPVMKFHNITYYETPVFEGNGYLVLRLPPRDMLYQHYREARGMDDEHSALSVQDEVTYS